MITKRTMQQPNHFVFSVTAIKILRQQMVRTIRQDDADLLVAMQVITGDILPPLNPEGFEVGASRSMGATAQVSTS
jgi:hypothetical protein